MQSNHEMFAKVESMRQQSAEQDRLRAEAARQKAEENRKRMPTIAAWVEKARAVLGSDVKVAYAKEVGISLGEKSPDGISMAETPISGALKRSRP